MKRVIKKKGFTLIELIVVMAVIGILVLLAAPRFIGQTKEATFTKHINNAKVLEDASERYYIDHGKWPRGADADVYTASEVDAYADKIFDITGEELVLEEGNYWDIDYSALSSYVKLPDESERANYVLRNPVGKVYYLEGLTEDGEERITTAVEVVESQPEPTPEPEVEPIQEAEPIAFVNGSEVELTTGKTFNFTYTGSAQSIKLPKGRYQLEVWGAQGGYNGGKGGYSNGVINVSSQQESHFYVNVGGQGNTIGFWDRAANAQGGWNGGGNGKTGSSIDRNANSNGGGGGATDIRIAGVKSLYDRIIVAGGGGGSAGSYYSSIDYGGYGGGFSGEDASNLRGNPGTQSSGGDGVKNYGWFPADTVGTFGKGGNGYALGDSSGGGGGGWYGGGGRVINAGGGGSGYVLTATSHKPSGYNPSIEYYLIDTQMLAGNQPMPNPQGGTMVGNSGNGYARITVLELN